MPERVLEQLAARVGVLVACVQDLQYLLYIGVIACAIENMATCAEGEPIHEAGMGELLERGRYLARRPAQPHSYLGRTPNAAALLLEVNEDFKFRKAVYRSTEEEVQFALHALHLLPRRGIVSLLRHFGDDPLKRMAGIISSRNGPADDQVIGPRVNR